MKRELKTYFLYRFALLDFILVDERVEANVSGRKTTEKAALIERHHHENLGNVLDIKIASHPPKGSACH